MILMIQSQSIFSAEGWNKAQRLQTLEDRSLQVHKNTEEKSKILTYIQKGDKAKLRERARYA